MLRRTVLAIALAVLAVSCSRKEPGANEPLKIAAASDLAAAFDEVGKAFEKETGQKVVFTFGSTGLISKQILEGAPYDVFAAANVSFVDEVVAAGECDKSTQALYARGRIVAWTGKGARAPKTLDDLADPAFAKVAIANPEHAPYGRAAKEALIKAGVYDRLQKEKRLVFGENVSQALQFGQSGNADVAIVALSLAVVADGDYFLVDEAMHAPLDQALVVCSDGAKAEKARAFADYVNSASGRAIMKKYGFLLPGEKTASAGD